MDSDWVACNSALEASMTREVMTLGYVFFLLFILSSNFWASKHPKVLLTLPDLLSRYMSERSTRLALGFIWWWIGWHFLYSNL